LLCILLVSQHNFNRSALISQGYPAPGQNFFLFIFVKQKAAEMKDTGHWIQNKAITCMSDSQALETDLLNGRVL
jgi:hypothetical protein